MMQGTGLPRGGEGPTRTASADAGPAQAAVTGTLVDPAALSEIRGLQAPGEPDVVATVVAMFSEECPVQLQCLGAAIARGDAVSLRAVAHNLKGSAAAIGAREVRALCQQLEDIGAAATVVGAADLATSLAEATERACAALEKLIAPGEQV